MLNRFLYSAALLHEWINYFVYLCVELSEWWIHQGTIKKMDPKWKNMFN